ncbi:MAG: HAMP domain-containing protein [Eubacteriales bacterium]|nr:HAMP domain-containing protein [Eubacteriales bacterium]
MRWIMMLTYVVAILITLSLMSVYILGVLTESLHKNESVNLFAKANIIADTVAGAIDVFDVFDDNADRQIEQIISGTVIRALAVNPSCTVLYDSNTEASLEGKVLMRDVINTAMQGEQAQTLSKSDDGNTIMSVAVPVMRDEKIKGVVYLVETIDDIDKTISYVKMNMIVFSVLISILVGMLSMGMSIMVTSRLDEFIKAAKEISNGNYKTRVNVSGDSELQELSDAMNSMCQALENVDETHKKFISDVSHELKTPLASIKLICDSIVDTAEPDIEMIKEFLADLSNEVDRLTRIVERLLTLTKIGNEEEQPTLTPVDFVVMLNAIMNRLRPNAEAKHILLCGDFDSADITPVLIDYDKLWEAVYNITDNAIKYTPENGTVKMELSSDAVEMSVSVSDNGPGIPESERECIFDRFYRLDDSRTRETGGTGLGLAIAKEAVLLHGGRIEVQESEMGGCKFIISIPKRTAEV